MATIYRRNNGLYGSACGLTNDTGHHITAKGDRFTVLSIKDDETPIAVNAPRSEAEAAIESDWKAAS